MPTPITTAVKFWIPIQPKQKLKDTERLSCLRFAGPWLNPLAKEHYEIASIKDKKVQLVCRQNPSDEKKSWLKTALKVLRAVLFSPILFPLKALHYLLNSFEVSKDYSKPVTKALTEGEKTLRKEMGPLDAALRKEFGNSWYCLDSIRVVLGMIVAGMPDGGEKDTWMEKLGFKGKTEKELHEALGTISARLRLSDTGEGRSGAVIRAANAIVIQGKKVQPSYVEKMKSDYEAEVIYGENGQELADKTNVFIKEATEGMIPEMLTGPIDPLLIATLNQAVYFKAEWSKEFDKNNTRKAAFADLQGEQTQVQMMHSSQKLAVHEGDDFMMASIPYKSPKGVALSFRVFLPKTTLKEQEFSAFQKKLDDQEFVKECSKKATSRKTDLALPRMDLSNELDVLAALEKVGLPQTLLTKIKYDAELAEILQKVKVEVDEKGTRAAAATTALVVEKSMPEKPFQFHVNRPCVCMIVKDGEVLFRGAVTGKEQLETS